jgi:hypothetical protein
MRKRNHKERTRGKEWEEPGVGGEGIGRKIERGKGDQSLSSGVLTALQQWSHCVITTQIHHSAPTHPPPPSRLSLLSGKLAVLLYGPDILHTSRHVYTHTDTRSTRARIQHQGHQWYEETALSTPVLGRSAEHKTLIRTTEFRAVSCGEPIVQRHWRNSGLWWSRKLKPRAFTEPP